ncbi:PREDICTED: beta-sarcoglycan [Charadrius vociferus]|nr:PREDICTED: beta-sarcoglycan [Charadrius vociferus]
MGLRPQASRQAGSSMAAQRQCINKAEAPIRAQHPRCHTGAQAKFVRKGVTVTQPEQWDGDSVSAACPGLSNRRKQDNFACYINIDTCKRHKLKQSSNGPVKKSMREKAVERRNVNKEHNSNFKAGYIPIDEDRLHKTGLRGRKGNLAICVIVLLFILAVINLIITLVIWAVIRIGPNGCDSMEFHESGLLRFKQVSDMGVIHPLYKSTVGGRRNEDLVITGNNQPIVFQQGTTKLSVEKDKTSITSDIGMEFVDPRTQNTLFSTDYETHEFHLPNGVKILNVQKASTERITSNATSDLNIKVDGRAIVRGNEGVFITGKTIEFRMGGNMELKAENSIILNGTVMVSPSRLPSSSYGEQFNNGNWLRFKLCMCADGTLFKVQVTGYNMGCQTSVNPCGATH